MIAPATRSMLTDVAAERPLLVTELAHTLRDEKANSAQARG